MVQGVIQTGGRSDLVIMTRDKASPRKRYSANSYLDVLDEQIPIYYKPGLTFMQDNARIHKAKKITDWFIENIISVLN